jgi:hypothetical protein
MMHRSAAAGQPPMQLDTIPCEGEWTMHFHLGRVFISHTAADKPFVRRLAARLEKSHFQVWLDEHNLIAGDPLPESIGKALQAAKVILVVVSKASVASTLDQPFRWHLVPWFTATPGTLVVTVGIKPMVYSPSRRGAVLVGSNVDCLLGRCHRHVTQIRAGRTEIKPVATAQRSDDASNCAWAAGRK